MQLSDFPFLNACLNLTSATFLITGFICVINKKITAHKICMVIASLASLIFLACYLYYHFHHGRTSFTGEGFVCTLYFIILISHTILAMVNLPMIIITLWQAITGNYGKHKKIARYTFPIWLYVSVTGVIIYIMLYEMGYS